MARLPEGALMQRAATRAGVRRARPARARRTARGCCCWSARATTAATRCTPAPCWPGAVSQVEAWLLTGPGPRGGAGGAAPAGGRRRSTAPARRPGRGRRRHRRHRRPRRAAARGRSRRSRRSRASRVVAVDTPVRRRRRHRPAGRRRTSRRRVTVTFGTHKVAHLVDPAAAAVRRRAPGRHRARPAARRGGGAAAGRRRGAAAAPAVRRAQVHPRRGRGPRRLERVPGRRRALRRRRRLRAGRDGPLRRRRRVATWCAQAHPEVVGAGPGPGLGGRLGQRRRRRGGARRGRWPTASRWWSTPTP